MAKLMQILLLIGSIGAFIFLAAACGGNAWVKYKLNSDIKNGLWKTCSSLGCFTIGSEVENWWKACRAFAVISVLAAVAGVIFAVLSLAIEKVKGFFASIFLLIAAGTMAIALIIYAAERDLLGVWEYAWSYILGWIGTVGAIAAGIFGFLA